ncbi:hypothetical protein ACTHQ6_09340 [Arthrobacter sp. SAFR-179]|uniref:hypothetical protein n=1 Tax=Arthrobacter sp. SAFR-179 TaxID=3387279 RepID=UPI003F7B5D8A
MTYSYKEFLMLRDGGLITASGSMTWAKAGASYATRIPATHPSLAQGEIELRMKINPKRPYSPHVLLITRDVCMLRLDVNGKHREGPEFYDCTHIQETPYPEARSTFDGDPRPPLNFPREGIVAPASYRSVFQYFVQHYRIEASNVVWNDPWKEGKRT